MKASELLFHVFHKGLAGYNASKLYKELASVAYLAGLEIKFAKVEKSHITHKYAFVTIATPISKEALLARPFRMEEIRLTFNMPIPAAEKRYGKESEDKDTKITTTIVITGISKDYGQAKISNNIYNLIGADNIIFMSYG
jgi:hypothetical protein